MFLIGIHWVHDLGLEVLPEPALHLDYAQFLKMVKELHDQWSCFVVVSN